MDEKYLKPGLQFAKDRLIEECGEVLSAIGKSGRFGWYSKNPIVEDHYFGETNIDWALREIDDLEKAITNFKEEARLYKEKMMFKF